MSNVRITLLGTGDTTGTPTVGCTCDTCERARREGIERTRFSVHVQNTRTDESVLIDFSPDFRDQFLTHDVSLPDAGIVTHIHFDHVDGLGNAYRLFDQLPVYAADEVDSVTDKTVAESIANKYHYLDRVDIRSQPPLATFNVCGLSVTLVPVNHPPLLCYGVVVEDPVTEAKLSITGDTCYDISQAARTALADADLMLADAIVPAAFCKHHPIGGAHHDDSGVPATFGTKHMTREGALRLADELDAQTTRLVHTAHFYPVAEAFTEPLAVDGEAYTL